MRGERLRGRGGGRTAPQAWRAGGAGVASRGRRWRPCGRAAASTPPTACQPTPPCCSGPRPMPAECGTQPLRLLFWLLPYPRTGLPAPRPRPRRHEACARPVAREAKVQPSKHTPAGARAAARSPRTRRAAGAGRDWAEARYLAAGTSHKAHRDARARHLRGGARLGGRMAVELAACRALDLGPRARVELGGHPHRAWPGSRREPGDRLLGRTTAAAGWPGREAREQSLAGQTALRWCRAPEEVRAQDATARRATEVSGPERGTGGSWTWR